MVPSKLFFSLLAAALLAGHADCWKRRKTDNGGKGSFVGGLFGGRGGGGGGRGRGRGQAGDAHRGNFGGGRGTVRGATPRPEVEIVQELRNVEAPAAQPNLRVVGQYLNFDPTPGTSRGRPTRRPNYGTYRPETPFPHLPVRGSPTGANAGQGRSQSAPPNLLNRPFGAFIPATPRPGTSGVNRDQVPNLGHALAMYNSDSDSD